MAKALLTAVLIYVVSVIAIGVYFTVVGTRVVGPYALLFYFFVLPYGALRWALIPTALYLVYAVIVKRIKKETLGVNHF